MRKMIRPLFFLSVIIGSLLYSSCGDPCKKTTCLNGGECVDGACDCAPGYSGADCSIADPCLNTDCQNGGECVNGTCDCPPGYSGANCQIADPCLDVTCLNDGICEDGTCDCPLGYQQPDCRLYNSGGNTGALISTTDFVLAVWHRSNLGHHMHTYQNFGRFDDGFRELAPKNLFPVDFEVELVPGDNVFEKYTVLSIGDDANDAPFANYTGSWSSFVSSWRQHSEAGYRLTDVETYVEGGDRAYIGLFRRGGGSYALYLMKGWENFVQKNVTQFEANRRLIDIETFSSEGDQYYLGVWRGGTGGATIIRRDNWDEFYELVTNQPSSLGLIDVETYFSNGKRWYIAVLKDGVTSDFKVTRYPNWATLLTQKIVMEGQGYRLMDFERY